MKWLVLLLLLVLVGCCKQAEDYVPKESATPTIENEYRQVDGFGLLY